MTDNSQVFCGPCDFELRTTAAVKWCTECHEGLCTECQKAHSRVKVSRDHFIISLEDYRKIENLEINLDCKIHEQKLELFCKTHYEAVCCACVPNFHKNCVDIIPIKEAAKNSKRSVSFDILEENVTGFIRQCNSSLDNRAYSKLRLERERTEATTAIRELRTVLNDKLEAFERVLSRDLNDSFTLFNSNIETFTGDIRAKEKEFQQILEQMHSMKAHASDLQMFVWMLKINKMIVNKNKELVDLKATDFHIKVDIDQDYFNFVSQKFEKLGKLATNENPIMLPINVVQLGNAQTRIEHIRTIQSVDVKKISDLTTTSFTGCAILPNGRVFIVNYERKVPIMYECDLEGNLLCAHREVLSKKPFDIACISNQKVAVTFGESKSLAIIDVEQMKEEKRIQLDTSCWGVSYDDGKLYVIGEKVGILILNDTGNVIKTIPVETTYVEYIAAHKNKVYYSNYIEQSVICCDVDGSVQWKFKDESLFHPRGIALDVNQNVLILGAGSDNLIIISSDGTDFKILLTNADGLSYPGPLCYSESNKVICLRQGVPLGSIYGVIYN